MDNILISNPEKLQEKIERFKKDGIDKIHILSDFDRTLTYAFVNGQKGPTVIAQLRNGNYLSPEYSAAAHALYDKYHPIETDPDIGREEKMQEMHDWWKKHFDLLVASGLTVDVMKKATADKTLSLRAGSLEFIDKTHEAEIPLIIMSAAPGDMVNMYLEQEGRLYDNVHTIANFLKFDEAGNFVGVDEPIIHSLNKHETVVKNYPVFNEIKNRKNVLLLGDSIDDIGMVEGFDYDEIIRIGFLNTKVEENKELFLKNFDVVITDDGDMHYINELMGKIVRG